MKRLVGIILVVALVVSGGCGEDAGDQYAYAPPRDVIVDGSGVDVGDVEVVTGVIEDFGSIIINGKRYITDDAVFNIKGNLQSRQDMLAKGDYVELFFTPSTNNERVASLVIHEPPVSGEITAVNEYSQGVTVVGQQVLITPSTRIGSNGAMATIDDFSVGDYIEVSGLSAGGNRLVASHITANSTGETFITGPVEAIQGNVITVRSTPVNISRLAAPAAITLGAVISVSGQYDTAQAIFIAQAYREVAQGPALVEGTVKTLEGFVSAVAADVLTIANTGLLIDNNTQILGAGSRADIAPQAWVIVTFRATTAARKTALTVQIKSRAPGQIMGLIEAKSPVVFDAQNRETGVITVNGQNVRILGTTAVTLLVDGQVTHTEANAYPYSNFNIGDDTLIIVNYDQNNTPVASRIYLYRYSQL